MTPQTAAPKTPVTVSISLESPAERQPVALQWETIVPAGRLEPEGDGMVIAPAAAKAGKALKCAVKQKSSEAYVMLCILAGGQKPIENGPVASLGLRTAPRRGAAKIRIEHGIAVLRNGDQAPVPPAQGTVRIR